MFSHEWTRIDTNKLKRRNEHQTFNPDLSGNVELKRRKKKMDSCPFGLSAALRAGSFRANKEKNPPISHRGLLTNLWTVTLCQSRNEQAKPSTLFANGEAVAATHSAKVKDAAGTAAIQNTNPYTINLPWHQGGLSGIIIQVSCHIRFICNHLIIATKAQRRSQKSEVRRKRRELF